MAAVVADAEQRVAGASEEEIKYNSWWQGQ